MTYKKQIQKILPEILSTQVLRLRSGNYTYNEWCQLATEYGDKTPTRRHWYRIIMESHYGLYQTWATKALNKLLDEHNI